MAKISASTNIDSIQVQEQADAPATPASGYGRIYCKSDGLYFIGDNGVEVGPLAATVGGYTEGARVYNNANISVTNAGDFFLTFNTERWDTDGIHDTGSNTGRLTCQTAGKYLIIGQIEWATNTTGNRQAYIRLNGTTDIARVTETTTAAMGCPRMIVTTIYDLAESDYVELGAYQNSGDALNVLSTGNRSPEFMMHRIG